MEAQLTEIMEGFSPFLKNILYVLITLKLTWDSNGVCVKCHLNIKRAIKNIYLFLTIFFFMD